MAEIVVIIELLDNALSVSRQTTIKELNINIDLLHHYTI